MNAFAVGDDERGTSEAAWAAHLAGVPALALPPQARVVVLAPHPDDEVLGVGGLLAMLGCAVDIVAITDGEASHRDFPDLAEIRADERRIALARLGVDARVTRLGLPDGGVSGIGGLDAFVAGASLVLAPWPDDGHPDHDATGAAARALDVPVAFYPIWAWHWARPDQLPWDRARRLDLTPAAHAAKLSAIGAYASQLEPYRGVTILPDYVLARFIRAFEILFV